MILTMTKEQFERRWYIIRRWIPPQQRKEALNFFERNKSKIDERTHLEITVPRD